MASSYSIVVSYIMKLSEVAVTEVLIYYQFYKEGTGGSGRHAQEACMKMWVIIIFEVFV